MSTSPPAWPTVATQSGYENSQEHCEQITRNRKSRSVGGTTLNGCVSASSMTEMPHGSPVGTGLAIRKARLPELPSRGHAASPGPSADDQQRIVRTRSVRRERARTDQQRAGHVYATGHPRQAPRQSFRPTLSAESCRGETRRSSFEPSSALTPVAASAPPLLPPGRPTPHSTGAALGDPR